MEELIKLTYNNDRITVLARDLHEFLEIGTAFKDWFPRMCEYGFEEGIDFNPLKIEQVRQEGNRNVTRQLQDYQLTIEMAKEIAMIQRNEKGKQARQYFIKCENQLKEQSKLPKNPKDILKLIVQANEETDKKVEELRNDVEDKFKEMPLFNSECEELEKTVRKVGTKVLGGYHSPAYNNTSIRQKVYSDIHRQVKHEFGVSTYKSIKREYHDDALRIINEYRVPMVLRDEINRINNQQSMDLGGTEK